jgi:hypothetical protein
VVPKLGETHFFFSPSRGGAVGADGRQPGSLTTTLVTSVTVPAHSARVLLKEEVHVP